jgi:Lamin Tail Domain
MSKISGGGAARRLVSIAVAGLLSWSVAGISGAQTPANSPIAITEVDPEGNSEAYGQDWFELTNVSSSAVSLSGWSMIDSHSTTITGSDPGAPLTIEGGSSSIAPGQSVIFFESSSSTLPTGLPATFNMAWLGTSTSNLLFGVYDDGGSYGLSDKGDSVNIFNASGTLEASVAFPKVSTTSGATDTFEVVNGVPTASAVGKDGAFLSSNGAEIGSPGVVPLPPSVWLLLSGIGLLAVSKRARSPDALR